MKRKIVWSLVVCVAIVIFLLANVELVVKPDESAQRVAQAFPVFQLKTANGRALSEKDFLSKLTLVNFFFDKCAPCIEEVPALNQFALDHPDIQVLALTSDSFEQVDRFVKTHSFKWPIVFDARKLISKELGITNYPTFMLVDETGKILGVRQGAESSGKMDQSLFLWVQGLRGK